MVFSDTEASINWKGNPVVLKTLLYSTNRCFKNRNHVLKCLDESIEKYFQFYLSNIISWWSYKRIFYIFGYSLLFLSLLFIPNIALEIMWLPTPMKLYYRSSTKMAFRLISFFIHNYNNIAIVNLCTIINTNTSIIEYCDSI